MPITRQKKEEVLKDLQGRLKKAQFVAFVNFHGLSVALATDLRRKLREAGAEYSVIKKTLIKKGLEGTSFTGTLSNLEGEVAVITSDTDPIAPAKVLQDFVKKNKVLKAVGGVFENSYVGPEVMVRLGSIPSREVLLAQIVNIINSPIQGLVVALSKIAEKKA
jgi:large subunit ribosomal protein L10